MDGIFVSKLNELYVPHDLHVNDPQVIVNGLVKDHVINKLLDLFTLSPDSLNSIDINVLKEFVDLLVAVDFMDQCPQKLDQGLIVVLNTEEKAIE